MKIVKLVVHLVISLFVCIHSTNVYAKLRPVDIKNSNSNRFVYVLDNISFFNDSLEPIDSWSLNFNYIDKPLIAEDVNGNRQKIINDLNYINFNYNHMFSEGNMLSFSVNYMNNNLNNEVNDNGLSDMFIQWRKFFHGENSSALTSMYIELGLPTGEKDSYLSTGKVETSIGLVHDRDWEGFSTSINLGLRHSPDNTYFNIDYTNSLFYGMGFYIPFFESHGVSMEFVGNVGKDLASSTGEVSTAYNYHSENGLSVYLGASYSGVDEDLNHSSRVSMGVKKKLIQKEAVAQCYTEPVFITYHARPLSDAEESNVKDKLPYNSSVRFQHLGKETGIDTYKLGEKTGISKGGLNYVKDAQIPFAVDIAYFPERSSIRKIHFARLKMTVNKIHNDGFLGTETLCLVDYSICSGEPISRDHWGKTLNKRYFPDGKNALNKNFGKVYLSKSVENAEKEQYYSSQITFPLENMLEGSSYQVEELLETASLKGSAIFVLADDTYPSDDIRLEVSMEVEKCDQLEDY